MFQLVELVLDAGQTFFNGASVHGRKLAVARRFAKDGYRGSWNHRWDPNLLFLKLSPLGALLFSHGTDDGGVGIDGFLRMAS